MAEAEERESEGRGGLERVNVNGLELLVMTAGSHKFPIILHGVSFID